MENVIFYLLKIKLHLQIQLYARLVPYTQYFNNNSTNFDFSLPLVKIYAFAADCFFLLL